METPREEAASARGQQEARREETLRRGHSEGESGRRAQNGQNTRLRRHASEAGLKNGSDDRLGAALGWFSIGLGVAAIAAPRGVSQLIGIGDHPRLLQAVGIREMASGIGILTNRGAAGWLWSRVAGDLMDLALLRAAFSDEGADRGRLAAATAAVTGITALDVRCSLEKSKAPSGREHAARVSKTVLINRSPEELYRAWRDFEKLPGFMEHLESVQSVSENRSHWVMRGPAGKRVEWDAEIVEDRPGELLSWRSLEGSDVQHSGSVRFEAAPGGRGCMVGVEMEYRPPAGVAGAAIAKLFGRAPDQEAEENLRRFKQLMEVGEILTTDGQPAGRARSMSRKYDHTVPRRDKIMASADL